MAKSRFKGQPLLRPRPFLLPRTMPLPFSAASWPSPLLSCAFLWAYKHPQPSYPSSHPCRVQRLLNKPSGTSSSLLFSNECPVPAVSPAGNPGPRGYQGVRPCPSQWEEQP